MKCSKNVKNKKFIAVYFALLFSHFTSFFCLLHNFTPGKTFSRNVEGRLYTYRILYFAGISWVFSQYTTKYETTAIDLKVRLVPILVPNPPLVGLVQPSQTRYSFTLFFFNMSVRALRPLARIPATLDVAFCSVLCQPACVSVLRLSFDARLFRLCLRRRSGIVQCVQASQCFLDHRFFFFPFQPSYPDCFAGVHRHR